MQSIGKLIGIMVAIVVLISLACNGSDNTGEKVGTTDTPAAQAQKAQTFAIGDAVKVQGHTIALEGVTVDSGKLIAMFVAENTGDKELNFSSLMQFDAKLADGTKMSSTMCYPAPDFGGKLLPGDKLRAAVCWKDAPAATAGVKIQYEATAFGSGAVIWVLE